MNSTPSTSHDNNNIFINDIDESGVMPVDDSSHQDFSSFSADKPVTRATFQQIPDKNFLLYAAKLYNHPDIPRNRVIEILNDTSDLFKTCADDIKNRLLTNVNECDDKNQIEQIFCETTLGGPHKFTEWNLLNSFKKLGTYIEPMEYLLGEVEEFVTKKNVKHLQMREVYAQFIPMRKVLKNLFELPNQYEETLTYVKSLKTHEIISNFIQGSSWHKLSSNFEDKTVFPVHIFFDDYETNNPLGSHKGVSKCGAIYFILPCLPPRFVSNLSNIFVLAWFNSLDRKVFRNTVVFSEMIDELTYLETDGVEIDLSGSKSKIFFKFSLFLGDNLGLHEILGFTTSFRSHSFCRFCKIKLYDIQDKFYEDPNLMRNENNYSSDLLKNDTKSTGIVEQCIFHKMTDFHVTQNLSVDTLHDILEGTCQYDLGQILRNFIEVKKYFELDEFNNWLKGFDYGHNKNTPPEILLAHIKGND